MFEHPVAQKTQWTPLVGGGTNFTTHVLRETPQGLSYRLSSGTRLLGGAFLVLGVGLVTVAVLHHAWPFLGGVLLVGAGAYFLRPVRLEFNRVARTVTVGHRRVAFADIAGLQLISESVQVPSRNENTYDSHELNLVLTDGTRLNVVDHAGRQRLRADLTRLQDLLGCPAWDATA